MYITLTGFAQLGVVIADKNTCRAKGSDIANLILNDDELTMINSSRNPGVSAPINGDEQGRTDSTIRDMWHEEGDDFFGHETIMPWMLT
jgi:chromatin-remodeling ATPase INO80